MSINPNPDRRARYAAAIAEGFRAFDADTTSDAYLDAELLDAVVAVADAEEAELRAVVARLAQMADHWEQKLPEVIRTPAVVSAIRAALEPAVSVVPPATNQAALLAEDLRYVLGHTGPRHNHEQPGVWDTSGEPCGHSARLAVAQQNLAAYDGNPDAVLPAPVDRAATLREAADELDAHATQLEGVSDDPAAPVAKVGIRAATEWRVAAALLRRMAAKTPQTETRVAEPAEIECAHCGREIENRGDPDMGGNHEIRWVHVPGGFTVCRPQQPTSPRAAPAVVAQPGKETSSCSTPNACDPDDGPCERHEREQSHAENDHSLCRRDECEVLRQS